MIGAQTLLRKASASKNRLVRRNFSVSKVIQDRKIEVDGIYLNYEEAGKGSHTVLCLPGIIGCIQADYGKLFDQINKDKFRIVSWDPPGYGKSRPPDRDFSGDFYRRDAHLVMKLMNKLGYDKYSVLGWSNGGITGAFLAADFPNIVTKLVTWGSHSYADERAVMFSRIMGNLDMWSDKMKAPMLDMYGEKYLLKMLKDWGDSVEEYYKRGDDVALTSRLPRIQCPALIIHGEEDPVLGVEHAEYLANHIKRAKLYIMPKAKHNLHLRYTEEFLELVEAFLLASEAEHDQDQISHLSKIKM
jgi:valacyclovir hydrolase